MAKADEPRGVRLMDDKRLRLLRYGQGGDRLRRLYRGRIAEVRYPDQHAMHLAPRDTAHGLTSVQVTPAGSISAS